MSYLGQNYNPSTPIRPDAHACAQELDRCITFAKHWVKAQQDQHKYTGMYQCYKYWPSWYFLNITSVFNHGDARNGRTMEHVRR